jgi:hypothetical protein
MLPGFGRSRKSVRADVKTGNVDQGASVIGVKLGLDEDEVAQKFREVASDLLREVRDGSTAEHEKFESLVADTRTLLNEFQPRRHAMRGPIQSLFRCESTDGRVTTGFAVNSSGLIVCPSSVGAVFNVENLVTKRRYAAQAVISGSLLQAARIETETHALVPAYLGNGADRVLGLSVSCFDMHGQRILATIESVGVSSNVASPGGTLVITNGYLAAWDGHSRILGGPVLTEQDEVAGVAVASASAGTLIATAGVLLIQPWSTIDTCIPLDA